MEDSPSDISVSCVFCYCRSTLVCLMHWMALCMHDLKLQLEVSKLASGKIVSQVTNFPNDSILHSRILTPQSLLSFQTPMEKSLRLSPQGLQSWARPGSWLHNGCYPEPGAHWPFPLWTVELEATAKAPPGQGRAGRGVPGHLRRGYYNSYYRYIKHQSMGSRFALRREVVASERQEGVSEAFLCIIWVWDTYQHPSESYREEDVLVWFQQEAIPLEKSPEKVHWLLWKPYFFTLGLRRLEL